MLKTLTAAAAFAAGLSVASAQPATAPMSAPDFVTAAGQSDQFEIQEGQLAEQMGSPVVKRFGARMVRDHTKTTAALMRAVQRSGMEPPPPPPLRPDQEAMLAQLQGLSGPAFDRAYVAQQIQSHQEALTLQSSYAQSGDASAIRAAARSAVPIVRMHLRMAQRMGSM